ncbi:MAG: hypothetical protein AB8E15_10905 [Bdellovibrionales bacterium]
MKILILSTLLVFQISCNVVSKRFESDEVLKSQSNQYQPSEKFKGLKSEVTLKADQSELENLRKEIPEEVRTKNDEMKLILDMFQDTRRRPGGIKTRFDRMIQRKKRTLSKTMSRERKKFSDKERKDRDSFLKLLKKEREEFNSKKPNSEQRKDFYDDQDSKRKEYFANSRDRRRDFESMVREVRTDTNAYFRDLQSVFREEMKIFKEKQRMEKREKKSLMKEKRDQARKQQFSVPPKPRTKTRLDQEFEQMDSTPSEPLSSE